MAYKNIQLINLLKTKTFTKYNTFTTRKKKKFILAAY